jgi:hypothetical protein
MDANSQNIGKDFDSMVLEVCFKKAGKVEEEA